MGKVAYHSPLCNKSVTIMYKSVYELSTCLHHYL